MLRKSPKPRKLNLGCGVNKLDGYINIDMAPNVAPDKCFDFTSCRWPFKDGTVDEIVIFHTIEHIRKPLHNYVISECGRVLKKGGLLLISFPDFWECAKNWHDNLRGARDFWEATLFGRQMFPSDYHVCAMCPDELKEILISWGFSSIRMLKEDPPNEFNTIMAAIKLKKAYTRYEDLIKEDVGNMAVVEKS